MYLSTSSRGVGWAKDIVSGFSRISRTLPFFAGPCWSSSSAMEAARTAMSSRCVNSRCAGLPNTRLLPNRPPGPATMLPMPAPPPGMPPMPAPPMARRPRTGGRHRLGRILHIGRRGGSGPRPRGRAQELGLCLVRCRRTGGRAGPCRRLAGGDDEAGRHGAGDEESEADGLQMGQDHGSEDSIGQGRDGERDTGNTQDRSARRPGDRQGGLDRGGSQRIGDGGVDTGNRQVGAIAAAESVDARGGSAACGAGRGRGTAGP